jgi:TetR/AcrR family transcriptional regulator, transcriptional repressor for nem operon
MIVVILWIHFFLGCGSRLHRRMTQRILWTMRYQPEHKAEVHQKIVKDASRRVRAEGISGAAVAAVMRDSGLTHGGFYKHFESKDDLVIESLHAAFREIGDALARAAEQSHPEEPWKAIVRTYLSLDFCGAVERGCPLTALGPELARVGKNMRGEILSELVHYRDRMVPFMPGRRPADKERAFFVIFSTMIGAVEIARLLPQRASQEKVLGNARDFLLASF